MRQNNGQKQLSEATFGSPVSGTDANCSISYSVPANAQSKATSTGLDVDWSAVFGADPSTGGKGTLCTLTYDLAFHGYQAAGWLYKYEETVHDYLTEYVVGVGADEVGGIRHIVPFPAHLNEQGKERPCCGTVYSGEDQLLIRWMNGGRRSEERGRNRSYIQAKVRHEPDLRPLIHLPDAFADAYCRGDQ